MGIIGIYLKRAVKELNSKFFNPSSEGMFYLSMASHFVYLGYPPNFDPKNHFKKEIWEAIDAKSMDYPSYSEALFEGMVVESFIEEQINLYRRYIRD